MWNVAEIVVGIFVISRSVGIAAGFSDLPLIVTEANAADPSGMMSNISSHPKKKIPKNCVSWMACRSSFSYVLVSVMVIGGCAEV